MKERNIKVNLKDCVEATPIAVFVQKANEYSSNIYIGEANRQVNAKSIMGVMSINFAACKELFITAEGDDEELAVNELSGYFESIKC